ncbi:MAG: L-2-amino-thiazoline-4-carboxylic acid hydrolase [Desulfobacterales bacterium]|nr:L-2-amino-thiazoline-4-carboxylic acid hydrolase [Desulfobacterales bacterium]
MDVLQCRSFSGRRSFLKAILPGGVVLGLGAPCLLRALQAEGQAKSDAPKHKFLTDAGITLAQAFSMTYLWPLDIFRGLETEIGRDKFHEMLKSVIDVSTKQQVAEMAKRLGSNDMAAFTGLFRAPGSIFDRALTFDIVEDTPKAFEVRVKECLWAKTYRDAKAEDLGYILSYMGITRRPRGSIPRCA